MAVMTAGVISAPANMAVDVYAFDHPVPEEKEPENAVRGEVIMQAIRYNDFLHPIQLDFYPETEGAVHRTFILNETNDYKLKEKVMVGTYRVAASIYTDMDMTDKNVRATATRSVAIKENQSSAPVVVALEGTEKFIKDYGWLTEYEDNAEGYLSGTITLEEAKEYFQKDIASQTEDPDNGDVNFGNTDGEIDYSENLKEDEDAIEFDAEAEEEKNSANYLKYIISGITVAAVGTAVAILIYKRKR